MIGTPTNILEISASSLHNIYIQFEHPVEQSLVTLDIDLRDLTNVKCCLYPSLLDSTLDDLATKIMQKYICLFLHMKLIFLIVSPNRSLSIPITMRGIFNRCKQALSVSKQAEQIKKEPEASTSPIVAAQSNQNGSTKVLTLSNVSNLSKNSTCSPAPTSQPIKNEFVYSNSPNSANANTPKKLAAAISAFSTKSNQIKIPLNNQNNQSGNAMLMSMLRDVPSAAAAAQVTKRKRNSDASASVKRVKSVQMSQQQSDPEVALIGIKGPMTESPCSDVENSNSSNSSTSSVYPVNKTSQQQALTGQAMNSLQSGTTNLVPSTSSKCK